MVRKPCLKGVPGCGCKGKCGTKTGTICCCSHTCAAICVSLVGGCLNTCEGSGGSGGSGGGEGCCSCEEPSFVYIEYDPTTQSYPGTISCGDVSIDVEFVVKYCSVTEECVLCLLSDCLVEAEFVGTGTQVGTGTGDDLFDGTCTNLVSCQPVAKGNVSCIGERDDDENLVGGIEHEWEVNVSGCGDSNCSAFTITSRCIPRIFPKEKTETVTGTGSGETQVTECGCTGCDCMCRDLCITYVGTPPCTAGARVPYGSENYLTGWGLDVGQPEGCGEEEWDRSISIVLQSNPETGECELVVTSSYIVQGDEEQTGTYEEEVLGTGTVAELETIIPLTSCPDIPFTKIWVDEANDQYFTFECWKCGACPEELICVCECDPDSTDGRGFDISRTLQVDWTATNNQGTGSGTISLERRVESCVWEGTLVVPCVDSDLTEYNRIYTMTFQSDDTGTQGNCGYLLQTTVGNFIGETPYTPIDNSCTNEFLDIIAQWDEGGGDYNTSCQCDPFSMSYSALPSEDESLGIVVTEG